MAQKKMNVRLLRQVQKHILADPRRILMETERIRSSDPIVEDALYNGERFEMAPCGTAACIAGWTYLLTHSVEESAVATGGRMLLDSRERLGLEDIAANRLFMLTKVHGGTGWPGSFESRYLKAKTPKTRAKITAARIDHFIKTKGAD